MKLIELYEMIKIRIENDEGNLNVYCENDGNNVPVRIINKYTFTIKNKAIVTELFIEGWNDAS